MRTGRPRFLPPGDETRRKIFAITAQQAEWLEAEATRCDMSEAAILRRLIRQAMEVES